MVKKVQDDEGYGYRIPFQQAVELAGTEKRLRVGQKKQTVSTWRKLGVPSHAVLRILLERMEAREITPPENVPAIWMNREWRATKRYTQAIECLHRLYSLGRYSELGALASLAAAMVNWTDEDWRHLHRARVDHLISRLREEAKI